MNLLELEPLFLEAMQKEKSKDTVGKYQERLRYFRRYCEEHKLTLPGDLSEAFPDSYSRYLAAEGLSSNTRHTYLDVVKRFLRFLQEESYLFLNLAPGIALPQWERKPKKTYSAKQVEKMLGRLDEPDIIYTRNKLIAALALGEQLRLKDIYALSVIDVDMGGQELRITSQKRFLKLKALSMKLLKAYLKKRHQLRPKTDWLLVNKFGERLRGQDIGKAIRQALGK